MMINNMSWPPLGEFIGDILNPDRKVTPFQFKDFKNDWLDALDFVFESFGGNPGKDTIPYRIVNGEKESKIYFNVPGIKKNQIKILIEGNLLKVEFPNKHYYEEKAAEDYKVSFKMGSSVDVNNIESKLEDGVLVVSINKSLDKKLPEVKVVEIK